MDNFNFGAESYSPVARGGKKGVITEHAALRKKFINIRATNGRSMTIPKQLKVLIS